MLDQKLEQLSEAATKVGNQLINDFHGIQEQILKDGTHYQAKEDIIADSIYQQMLSSTNIPICSEESMLNTLPDTYWLIDPLEGTTNFTHGNPFFATQACLVTKGEVVCAVVYAPIFNQLFTAIKNGGAKLNGKQIQIGQTNQLSQAIVSPNKGTGAENLAWWGQSIAKISSKVRTIRLFGAVGLELAYVAAGFLDIHYNNGCHAYDDAPGSLIVKEAGGEVTNFNSDPWNITQSTIIAGRKELISELTTLLPKT